MPNGIAKCWIPGGSVDFESTAIQMLVVSGNRAQFWQLGAAQDAAVTTEIDGGNIQIRRE